MKWINVEKELPKDDKLKIIRYILNGKKFGIALSRYYTPSSSSNIKIWCFELVPYCFVLSNLFQATDDFTDCCLKVSHWCTIPKEPS